MSVENLFATRRHGLGINCATGTVTPKGLHVGFRRLGTGTAVPELWELPSWEQSCSHSTTNPSFPHYNRKKKKKKTVLETTLFYYFTLFLCPTQPLHNYVKWMEKTWNVLLLWDEIQLGEGADKEKEEKEVMRNRHEEIMSQINQLCKWILSNQLLQPKAVQICLCWWLRAVKVILVQLWVVRCWPESDS